MSIWTFTTIFTNLSSIKKGAQNFLTPKSSIYRDCSIGTWRYLILILILELLITKYISLVIIIVVILLT